MKHPPSQAEVDLELSKNFIDGDFKNMGDELERDRSYISKLYSPNDLEHKNPFYTALRHLYYANKVRSELALGLFKTFDIIARQIIYNGEKRATGLQDKELRDAIFDLVSDELQKMPMAARLKAVQRARMEIEKFEDALMHLDMDSEVEQVSNATS